MAIGVLVGALTIGSALPCLFRAIGRSQGLDWRLTVASASVRLTLPFIVRRAGQGAAIDGDEGTRARAVAYQAGLDEIARGRATWADHEPLFDRLVSGLRDRTRHLATSDPEETAERRQERIEHEQIQRAVIAAQRAAVIELRDRREINDQTLRSIERELDLEEIRMEA